LLHGGRKRYRPVAFCRRRWDDDVEVRPVDRTSSPGVRRSQKGELCTGARWLLSPRSS
jgi:hypothetical protein